MTTLHFEGCVVRYRRGTTAYFLRDGVVSLENRQSEGAPLEYSHSAFCKNVKDLKCVGYIVAFLGAAFSISAAPRNTRRALPAVKTILVVLMSTSNYIGATII